MRSREASMPSLSLSIRAPLAGGSRSVTRDLARRGNPPLDLDLTVGSPVRAAVGVAPPAAFAGVAPACVWLPEHPDAAAARAAIDRTAAAWPVTPPALVAIDLPLLPEGRFIDLIAAAAAAERFRAAGDGNVVVALRARHIAGGRRHLAQLSLLRRSLEEWNLTVAIDLSGPFDPQWEAEAAIMRLAGLISLLRVSAASLSPAAVDRDRVARRALRAAIEARSDLPVSVAPARRWWPPIGGPDAGEAWNDVQFRLNALRFDARHVDPPQRRGGLREPHSSNPSGLA